MTNICVFCGSSTGNRPEYRENAEKLGRLLAQNDCQLIYGGGKLGLMGRIAQSVLDAGGKVTGVIPEFMMPREVAHEGLTQMIITESMHSRKAEMARRSDGFVVMPGGFGTLDEMAEILTWNQLGIIQKPVVLLNTKAYFKPLISMIDHMKSEGFLRNSAALHIVSTPDEVIPAIINYQSSEQNIWDHLDKT